MKLARNILLVAALMAVAFACGRAERHPASAPSASPSATAPSAPTPSLPAAAASAQVAGLVPGADYYPDRFMVSFRLGAKSARGANATVDYPADSLLYQHAELAQLAREIRDRYEVLLEEEAYFRSVNFAAYRTRDGSSAEEVMRRIGADYANSIEFIEYDGIAHGGYAPNDPYYPDDLWGIVKVNADDAWDDEKGDSAVLVAVIDSGVRYSGDTEEDAPDHEDLAGNVLHPPDYWPGEMFDRVDQDNVPEDEHRHGTHVSGTVGAVGDNGLGVVGVAYEAAMVPIRVLDAGNNTPWSRVIAAVTLADAIDADIINMSLGGTNPSALLKEACEQAYSDGVFIAVAAMNANSDAPWYPAYYDVCCAVGATTTGDHKANFSNYGDWVDIGAPGVDIESTLLATPSSYGTMSGTSMATPHVSGAAALLLSCDPLLTLDELRTALETTGPLLDAGEWSNADIRRLDARAALDWALSQRPSITITSPQNGSTVQGTVNFSAEVTDDSEVTLVEMYIDDQLKASFDHGGTCEYSWVTTDYHGGGHTLRVYAEDDTSRHSEKSISVTVKNHTITGATPASSATGETVIIEGSYFLGDGGDAYNPPTDRVYFRKASEFAFDWTQATVSEWHQSAVQVVVPADAATGPLKVSINGAEVVSGFDFTVLPHIDALVPDVQVVGGNITVEGTGFGVGENEDSKVEIGGLEAEVISWSNTAIEITIPAGVTQSDLTVTTTAGTSNGVLFTPQPHVADAQPTRVWHGAELTLTGTSFGDEPHDSKVTFGGGCGITPEDIVTWSETELVLLVPVGAQPGEVFVTVNDVDSNGVYLTIVLPPPLLEGVGQY